MSSSLLLPPSLCLPPSSPDRPEKKGRSLVRSYPHKGRTEAGAPTLRQSGPRFYARRPPLKRGLGEKEACPLLSPPSLLRPQDNSEGRKKLPRTHLLLSSVSVGGTPCSIKNKEGTPYMLVLLLLSPFSSFPHPPSRLAHTLLHANNVPGKTSDPAYTLPCSTTSSSAADCGLGGTKSETSHFSTRTSWHYECRGEKVPSPLISSSWTHATTVLKEKSWRASSHTE